MGEASVSGIPKLVHLVWLGSEPGAQLRRTIERLRELHPDWEVRLWRDSDLDWLKNRKWFESVPTWAGRSDIARYEIILRCGGFYVDADFEFLRSLNEANLNHEGVVVVKERQDYFCNGFFGAPAGHPFVARLVDRVGASIDSRPQASPQDVSGPAFFTDQLMQWSTDAGEAWSEIDRDLIFPYSFDKLDHASGPLAPDVIAVRVWDQARNGASRESRVSRLRRRLRIRSRLRVKARAVRRVFDRLMWRPNSVYLGDGRGLVVGRQGRAIIVELSDTYVLSSLVARGWGDESLHRFLPNTLSGSDVYVDVGANIGQFVDTAAQSLSHYGRVFAYEPNPRVADTLALNVQMSRNSGARAEVIERRVAVSDSTVPVTLRVPTFHAGRGSMVSTSLSDVDVSKLDLHDVSCVTLDDELGHLSRIRLIKIDVEGNEPAVLAGATALVESGRVDLIDIESVRAHLGSSVVRLGAILDRWQDMGATFADIGSRGELLPIQQRGSVIVASADRSHLIIDLRPIRTALQKL